MVINFYNHIMWEGSCRKIQIMLDGDFTGIYAIMSEGSCSKIQVMLDGDFTGIYAIMDG